VTRLLHALAFVVSVLWCGLAGAQVPSGYVNIGNHGPGSEWPTLSCTPGASLGFLRSASQAWFSEGVCPSSGSYMCAASNDPATGQTVGWSGWGLCYEAPAEGGGGSTGGGGSVVQLSCGSASAPCRVTFPPLDLTEEDAAVLVGAIAGLWLAAVVWRWLASVVWPADSE